MAKQTRTASAAAQVGKSHSQESKLEAFAEDLGDLLGRAQSKAETWLGQRKAIAERLEQVRDAATRLLAQLGVADASRARRRGRPARSTAADGGAAAATAKTTTPAKRKKRTMSAEARARISAAQKARWAKVRKAAKD